MIATLRSEKGEAAYTKAKERGDLKLLSEEPRVCEFDYWYIVENRFPYDLIFKTSHMLLPRRVVANKSGLTVNELEELETIKKYYVDPIYDVYFENTTAKRSVLGHYHIHLLTYYDSREEIKL